MNDGNNILRHRIILCFLLSLLPISITSLFAYTVSRAIITKNTTRYSLDILAQSVADIQLKLGEFENISVRLFINNKFKNTIAGFVTAKDDPKQVQAKNSIKSYFNEYMIDNPDIFAFMFISNRNPKDSIILSRNGNEELFDLAGRFKTTPTYKNIYRAGGGIVWSSSIKIHNNYYLVLGRVIKETATGQVLGTLAVIVDEERLDRLANLNMYNKVNSSLGNIENYNLIINREGEIVSTPFKKEIGNNISELMDKTHRDRRSNETAQGSYITRLNNKETLVTYKKISSKIGAGNFSGWYLLSLTPTSALYTELGNRMMIVLTIGCLIQMIGLLIFLRIKNHSLECKGVNRETIE